MSNRLIIRRNAVALAVCIAASYRSAAAFNGSRRFVLVSPPRRALCLRFAVP
jgi:hypothetical protein